MDFDYDSEEWEDERDRVLEGWGGLCDRCGFETDSPHIHHKYGTNVDEYEILCPECHADHHGKPEIARFQRSLPRCKYCHEIIRWDRGRDGRWIPLEQYSNNRHRCGEV
jgi:hypothetical protein